MKQNQESKRELHIVTDLTNLVQLGDIIRIRWDEDGVDVTKHELRLKGKSVEVTAKEFELLRVLMSSKGRVLTREVLLSKVWGYENSMNIETRTVDMHIGQLRKKIGKEAERIVTVKSVGYRFDGE